MMRDNGTSMSDSGHTDAASAARPRSSSPTTIANPRLRFEARRAMVWTSIIAVFALAVYMSQALLVVFGGLVFASLIDGGARLLGKVLPIGRGWRVALVLVLTALFLAWLLFFAGSQLAEQAALFPTLLEQQANRLLGWLRSQGIIVSAAQNTDEIVRQALGGIGQLTRVVGGIIGGFTTIFLIIILGIYIAIEPRLYERGVAWMIPDTSRDSFLVLAGKMAAAMRRLLFGRLIGMVFEGVITWIALAAYGVPLASLLGLLTGLLAFIPNIGAVISGLLMVLVGFSGGTSMALYAFGVYLVIQTVDGYILVPMIARKTVDLAPALVLAMQLILGVLFGILGLALADPLVAMIKVALEHRARRAPGDRDEATGRGAGD